MRKLSCFSSAQSLGRALLPVLLALLVPLGGAPPLRAEQVPAPAWEPTALAVPTGTLSTPASGAFFVAVEGGLFRSDDAGASWRAVDVPARPPGWRGLAAVALSDHAVIYAAGEDGLYRTTDDAASWRLVLPTPWSIYGLAVSPVDPALVYLAMRDSDRAGVRVESRRLRSRDGGATWDELEHRAPSSPCAWTAPILAPHPTDAGRVFSAHSCVAGRTLSLDLDQSIDQWATTTVVATGFRQGRWYARELAGGRGTLPGRYYLAATRDDRVGGAGLFRSDDDGATWAEVLGSPRERGQLGERIAPEVRHRALAYDPSSPERVYLAWEEVVGAGQEAARTHRVLASPDGGASWADLSGPDFPAVRDLALGIDGRYLYAATDRGVWRLPIAE